MPAQVATATVIGIVGGLGPHAHVELERLLLAATAERLGRPAVDQDYPAWLVSSIPSTPDRTLAVLGRGPSPVPALLLSVCRLAKAGAGFAVLACNTAHAFIDELREGSPIPILSVIEATLDRALLLAPPPVRVGLLATTGTCRARIYHEEAKRRPGLELFSLLDLPNGEALQERLVMTPIYGALDGGVRAGGGLKSGVRTRAIEASLHEAVRHLADAGAKLVICGCTEIPLGLGRAPSAGTPLLDSMEAVATRVIARAFGDIE